MKKITASLALLFVLTTSSLAFAQEGPVKSDDHLRAQVSNSGWVTIYGVPNSANCFGNKVEVPHTREPEMRQMALSLVTAAQLAGTQLNFWFTRYDTTTPQRCELRFIEMNSREPRNS